MKSQQILLWVLRILAALIMVQSLFFKFSASEESVYIFTTVGMEPWGRIATGTAELIAAILLLWPKTTVWGAVLAAGVMSGAIFFHLTSLGIVVKEDGGQLFIYALIVFIASLILIWYHKEQLFCFFKKMLPAKAS
ncbi:DoxX family protein [Lacibacter sp. MH-610]|uniref:DoxX family protein n=1 Tax=Lacibacter sp. MH-610 TaxID=3020883 RepID=UPI0038915242